MHTAPTTVIFDLDGTLIDSRHAILASLREACDITSTPRLDSSTEKEVLGTPITDVLPKYMPLASVDRVWAAFLQRYTERSISDARLFPGVADLLAELAKRGVQTAVATNKLEWLAIRILNEAGIDDGFSVIIWRDEQEVQSTKVTLIA